MISQIWQKQEPKLQQRKEIFPAPPEFNELLGLDLSHLTSEERAAILQVAARAKEVEQTEAQKVKNIQKQVQSFSANNVAAGSDQARCSDNRSKISEIASHNLLNTDKKGSIQRPTGPNLSKVELKMKKSLDKDEIRNLTKQATKHKSNSSENTKSIHKDLKCSLCSTLLSKSKNNSRQRNNARRNLKTETQVLPEALICASCSSITCKGCSSSSVLANKGEILCKLCMKHRELAARSNVWLKHSTKSNLQRSASFDLANTASSGSKPECRGNKLTRSFFRRRSYSAGPTKSKPDNSRSPSGFCRRRMSVSEALIRQLSLDKTVQNELRKMAEKEEKRVRESAEKDKVECKKSLEDQDGKTEDTIANEATSASPDKRSIKLCGLSKPFQLSSHNEPQAQNQAIHETKTSIFRSPAPYLSELKQTFAQKDVLSTSKKLTNSSASPSGLKEMEPLCIQPTASSSVENYTADDEKPLTSSKVTIDGARQKFDKTAFSKRSTSSSKKEEKFVTPRDQSIKPLLSTVSSVVLPGANIANTYPDCKEDDWRIPESLSSITPVNQYQEMHLDKKPELKSSKVFAKERHCLPPVEEEKVESAPSIVSSCGESADLAEWSVDELDDGDTFFLVTSSRTERHSSFPPGITTPGTLRSAYSQKDVPPLATTTSPITLFHKVSDGCSVIDDEKDTEGDFDAIFANFEEEEKKYYNKGLKRTSPFCDLYAVAESSSNGHSDEENKFIHADAEKINNTKDESIKKDEAAPAEGATFSNHLHGELNPSAANTTEINTPKTATYKNLNEEAKTMLPGESFFKTTNCDIDFSDNETSDIDHGKSTARKLEGLFFPKTVDSVKKIEDHDTHKKMKPVPAKRLSKSTTIPPIIKITGVNETTRLVEKKFSSESFSSTAKPPEITKSINNKAAPAILTSPVEESLSVKNKATQIEENMAHKPLTFQRSQYVDRSLSKPSSSGPSTNTKLPVFSVVSSSDNTSFVKVPQDTRENKWKEDCFSDEAKGQVYTVFSASSFSNDSESDTTTSDLDEEERSILEDATSLVPIYPEEMEEYGNDVTDKNSTISTKSIFFRRTTSTDNFEELLKKTSDTPRPQRFRSSSSQFIEKRNSTLNLDSQKEKDKKSCVRSLSLSPPKEGNESANSRRKSDPFLAEFNKIDRDLAQTENASSEGNNHPNAKKDTQISLTAATLDRSLSTSTSICGMSSSLPLRNLSRCVSCGALSNNDDTQHRVNVVINTTEPAAVKVTPPSTLDYSTQSAVKSVNSSTQVSPKQETAQSVASFDLCQLTALIQALKETSEVLLPDRKSTPEREKKSQPSLQSDNEEQQVTSRTVREPHSGYDWLTNHLPQITDASTETSLTGEAVILPQDKVIRCRRYTSHHATSSPVRKQNKVDVAVGTETEDMFPRSSNVSQVTYDSRSHVGNREIEFYPHVYRGFEHTNRSSSYPVSFSQPHILPPLYGYTIQDYPTHFKAAKEDVYAQGNLWPEHRFASVPSRYRWTENQTSSHYPRHQQNLHVGSSNYYDTYGPLHREFHPHCPEQYHVKQSYRPEYKRTINPEMNVRYHSYDQTACDDALNYTNGDIQPVGIDNQVTHDQIQELETLRQSGQGGLVQHSNDNFNLKRSVSVPTVSKTDIETKKTLSGNNVDRPMEAMEEAQLDDCPDSTFGYSHSVKRHHPATGSSQVETSHQTVGDRTQSFTGSSTGISSSNGANVLSSNNPPTGKNSGPAIQHDSNKYESCRSNSYASHLQHSSVQGSLAVVQNDMSGSVSNDGLQYDRYSSQRYLPQPPDKDMFEWRYNSNKRCPSLSSTFSTLARSTFSGSSLQQTMEHLNHEERELDLKLRYLELGRLGKTSSLSCLAGKSATYSETSSGQIKHDSGRDASDSSRYYSTSAKGNVENKDLKTEICDKRNMLSHGTTRNTTTDICSNVNSGAQSIKGNFVIADPAERNWSKAKQSAVKDSDKIEHTFLDDDLGTTQVYERPPRKIRMNLQKECEDHLDDVFNQHQHSHQYNLKENRKKDSLCQGCGDSGHFHRRSHFEGNSASHVPANDMHHRNPKCSIYNNHKDHHNRQLSQNRAPSHQPRHGPANVTNKNRKNNSSYSSSASSSSSKSKNNHASLHHVKSHCVNYLLQNPEDFCSPWNNMINDIAFYSYKDHGKKSYFKAKDPYLDEYSDKEVWSYQRHAYRESEDSIIAELYHEIQTNNEREKKLREGKRRTTKRCFNAKKEDNEKNEYIRTKPSSEAIQSFKELLDSEQFKVDPEDIIKNKHYNRRNVDLQECLPAPDDSDCDEEDVRVVVSDTEVYSLRREVSDWFDKPSAEIHEDV
ncbi:uncharacterized protein LOC143459152 isoform X1 [Clavelina lepadiformis]|uniref:uncharacterized protein LOC143459152 isoform X1 n=1 Tax=Clavelina lepadiformis TaxID=159417 RepID=UPI004041809A